MNSTEPDIAPTGETCDCGGRILQRTCPTCDDQQEYCDTCGETELHKLHRQEVDLLTTKAQNLEHEVRAFEILHNGAVDERDKNKAEAEHDLQMLGDLFRHAEKDARYFYDAVMARNHYARGNRNQEWLANMCAWCQEEDGQHTAECPEQQWPTRRPRRRERTGRPLSLLFSIPGMVTGAKTCRDRDTRCPFLTEIADLHSCMLAVGLRWMPANWLKHDATGQPLRCDGCINAEE